MTARPFAPCTRCGHPTQAKKGRCQDCRRAMSLSYQPSDALTGGHWALDPGTRVQVWIEDAA